ncbi:MAG: hypothetical protein JO168_14015 [Solirubrobacterales bacterium]|nr:hypothetical protein [Solirubrobacterales bacterium]MBV9716129.1 hypothetical protein [Solirubrobacterales bacterium]
MAERRGFWSNRPRKGGDDAQLLVAERVHDVRHVGYDELRRRAAAGTEVEEVSGPDGKRYQRRTSVKRMSRGADEELRIHISVVGGGRLARLNPLVETVLLASPDGEIVGDYTLAGEANDPRRYQWPGGRSRKS